MSQDTAIPPYSLIHYYYYCKSFHPLIIHLSLLQLCIYFKKLLPFGVFQARQYGAPAFSEGLQHPHFLPPLFYRLFSISLQNLPPVYYSSRLKAQKSVTYTQNYGPLPSSEKRDSPKGEQKRGKRPGWHGGKSGTEKIEATNHSETSMILRCPGGIRGYPTAAATATN